MMDLGQRMNGITTKKCKKEQKLKSKTAAVEPNLKSENCKS